MRRRRRNRNNGGKGAPKWMVTYSDMVTLILVFFILLYTMSTIDAQRFEAVSESFQNRAIFDFLPSAIPLDNPSSQNYDNDSEFPSGNRHDEQGISESDQEATDKDEQDSFDGLLEEVEAFLDTNQLNDVITANRSEEGVVLVLQESILFETAEADILDTANPFLDQVAQFLQEMPNQVRVEGHTDSRPIYNYRFPSNWELSAARAATVIRYFTDEFGLEKERFFSVGYADTRPIAPNDSEANWSKNRRVEIVILETEEEQGVG